jgi:hypothetical protein
MRRLNINKEKCSGRVVFNVDGNKIIRERRDCTE